MLLSGILGVQTSDHMLGCFRLLRGCCCYCYYRDLYTFLLVALVTTTTAARRRRELLSTSPVYISVLLMRCSTVVIEGETALGDTVALSSVNRSCSGGGAVRRSWCQVYRRAFHFVFQVEGST